MTIPNRSKIYLVVNGASGAVSISAGGTAASIPAGLVSYVYCDGTNCQRVLSNDFAGQRVTNVGTAIADGDAVNYALLIATAFATQAGSYPGLMGNKRRHLTVNDAETSVGWDWAHVKPFVTKVASYTAVAGDRLLCDTTTPAAGFTITLPASPAEGDMIHIQDGGTSDTAAGFARYNLTIGRNGSTIHGFADDVIVDTRGLGFSIEYKSGTWRLSNGC